MDARRRYNPSSRGAFAAGNRGNGRGVEAFHRGDVPDRVVSAMSRDNRLHAGRQLRKPLDFAGAKVHDGLKAGTLRRIQ